MSAFTYSEMLIQFKKICAYYFFDENFESKIMTPIIRKIPDEKNINDYVKQNEEETDDFIHKIASFVDGDRNESIKIINNAPEEILTTLIIRLLTFDDYCHKNPNKSYPVLEDSNQQLVIECLINFWRSYNHNGSLNFVV